MIILVAVTFHSGAQATFAVPATITARDFASRTMVVDRSGIRAIRIVR